MRLVVLIMAVSLSFFCSPALAWDPFRSENDEVREGNAQLEQKQLDKAIAAYTAAAKRLPNEAGVHLDRGIALLQAGKSSEAREALRIATQQGTASPEVRGKAHYNLGLAFMKDADTLAKEENLEEAQKLLRESADAFKSSLRASPKNRDAAWNLELAKRRLVDLDKKQQEKKEQQKKDDEEKKKNEENKDDKDKQDGDKNDQEGDEQKKDDGENKDAPEEDAGVPKDDGADAGTPEAPDAGADKPDQKPEPEEKQDESQEAPDKASPALPQHMQNALDALENSEENLQKHRAAMRARQRPRRIEKDW